MKLNIIKIYNYIVNINYQTNPIPPQKKVKTNVIKTYILSPEVKILKNLPTIKSKN